MRLETLRSIVRPIVTLVLIVSVIAAVFMKLVPGDVLVRLAELATVFYFVQRQQEKRGQA